MHFGIKICVFLSQNARIFDLKYAYFKYENLQFSRHGSNAARDVPAKVSSRCSCNFCVKRAVGGKPPIHAPQPQKMHF